MAEHEQNKKERVLPGGITEGPTTDAFISRRIGEISREIEATSETVIDVSSEDVLTPKVVSVTAAIHTMPEPQVGLKDLTAKDSLLGLALHQKRQLKKAA